MISDALTKLPPKTALITGAAKRIGRAIALRLAQDGYDIGVHYSTSEREAQALVAEITAMGVKAVALKADLADATQATDLFQRAVSALGPIGVLVNNASIFQNDEIGDLSVAGFQTHAVTNLLSPLMLSQAFAAQTEIPEEASIINLIDQRVLRPSPPFLSYALSKAGLWHATRTLAQALAPRVRVNAIGPGPILQSIHQTPDDFALEAQSTLLQRPASPEEVAETVIYLLSAKSVTGQMICVDSGQHLG